MSSSRGAAGCASPTIASCWERATWRCCPTAALPSDRIGSTVASLRYGGDGERALLICGGIHFAGPVARPLLELLPATLVVRRGDGEGWLAATLALLSAEARTPRPGGPAVLTRLMDVLVIQAIRAWLAGDAVTRRSGQPWR